MSALRDGRGDRPSLTYAFDGKHSSRHVLGRSAHASRRRSPGRTGLRAR